MKELARACACACACGCPRRIFVGLVVGLVHPAGDEACELVFRTAVACRGMSSGDLALLMTGLGAKCVFVLGTGVSVRASWCCFGALASCALC